MNLALGSLLNEDVHYFSCHTSKSFIPKPIARSRDEEAEERTKKSSLKEEEKGREEEEDKRMAEGILA